MTRNLFVELLAGAAIAVLAHNPAAAQPSPASPSADVRRLMMIGSVNAAKEKLTSCADAQDAECQYLLAEWIERGELYQRDLEAARNLYTLSYRNGYEKAGSAILRLAKHSDTNVSVASAKPSTPTASDKSQSPSSMTKPTTNQVAAPPAVNESWNATRNDKALASAERYPATPSSTLQQSERNWSVAERTDKLAKAPDFFGFQLDELDDSSLLKLSNATCDAPPSYMYRTCNGDVNTSIGAAKMALEMYGGRTHKLTVSMEGKTACDSLEAFARDRYGRHRLIASRFAGALINRAMAEDNDPESLKFQVWNNAQKDVWTLALGRSETRQVCFFGLAPGQGAKE